MFYSQIIDSIVGRYNLSYSLEREQAYRECIHYANKYLLTVADFNIFSRKSANTLGVAPYLKNPLSPAVISH